MKNQLLKNLISDDEVEEIKQNLQDYFSTLIEWMSEAESEETEKEKKNGNQ